MTDIKINLTPNERRAFAKASLAVCGADADVDAAEQRRNLLEDEMNRIADSIVDRINSMHAKRHERPSERAQRIYAIRRYLFRINMHHLQEMANQPEGNQAVTNENDIEREIVSKGLTMPRITPEMIEATIKSEQYWIAPGTTLTICVLTLENGFTVTGESACASPENFDEEIGRKISRGNACDKIKSLEGYLLRQKQHEAHSASNDAQ